MKEAKTNCRTCLNKNCIIKEFSEVSDMRELIEAKNELVARKGQRFILEGATVHGLYFVYQGKIKVGKTGFRGKEQIVRFATNGEVIGHRGFAVAQKYQINAVALEASILCSFSNKILDEMMERQPQLIKKLLLFYAEELNRSETKIRKIAQMTVREKVVDAILYFIRKFGCVDNFLNISLSRKEIADFAGTTEEQVIRVISSLKKDEILFTNGKKIGIVDIDKLKNEISEHNFFIAS